ncbi:phosphopantetheine-binding protein, partial [Yoonia sp. R2-816]|uniref:phosphopantetheine-binding protein n=1 Tax=Yoonia sp. R2-816 TaxID=3342638 RepID=UPI00372AAEE6
ISNTQVYVVDDRLQPQPVGVAGELLIGGVQVARGYLGRAGLTAEKFIADPFSDTSGSRLYRTGDLARWRPDGRLEFLGRLDHQVKIRGMRVELGEIEAALAACADVAQAVVTAPVDQAGDRRLVAYVVPQEVPEGLLADSLGIEAEALTDDERAGVQVVALEGVVDLAAVRSALKHRLPDHMVPSGFVGLSRLPLTASGKVDRKALPDVGADLQRAAYEAPRNESEALVASIFAELLRVEGVGAEDSFFDLGGHSLLAVRLVARLEAETGKSVSVRTVFETPTVAGLAAAL